MKKQQGNRTQLWKMNSDNQLEHEGSSPPSKSLSTSKLVLDCEKHPQADGFTYLIVALPNAQRRSTQCWKFTPEGRLACGHKNLCVQPQSGMLGLRSGEQAVLAPCSYCSKIPYQNNCYIEQRVRPQQLRPGSGQLLISIGNDGSTTTIEIKDKLFSNTSKITVDPFWKYVSEHNELQNLTRFSIKSIDVSIMLLLY